MDNNQALEAMCRTMLESIGEDVTREGLVRTPARFARALRELTVGYQQSADEIVNEAIFSEDHSEMILVKDVEFYSLCEHHLLPFFGKASVAYIPNGKIIGLSKIPRIINMYARRLQVQERMTKEICDEMERILDVKGVACSIEGYHMCMMMRGIQVQSSKMITNDLRGLFRDNPSTRQEFFEVLRK